MYSRIYLGRMDETFLFQKKFANVIYTPKMTVVNTWVSNIFKPNAHNTPVITESLARK